MSQLTTMKIGLIKEIFSLKIKQHKNRTKTEKIWYHPLFPHPNPNINEPPPTFPSPINWCNNTMLMRSLAQTRQCNGYGSARNDVIFNSHLGFGLGPWVSISYFLQETNHIHWLHLPRQIFKKKQKLLRKDQTLNKSYCIALGYIQRTQG